MPHKLFASGMLKQRCLSSRLSGFMASAVVHARRAPVAAPAKSVVVEVDSKLKTRKSCSKRLRVTGNGKIMGRHAGKQHFNEKMSRDDIREGSKMFVLSSANLYQAIKCLPHHGINAKGCTSK